MIKPDKSKQDSKKIQVKDMFNDISSRYDQINKMMTLNMDKNWRKIVYHLSMQDNPSKIIDIALIPCVAFNDKLFRLGMGGGFYDRTFSKKSSTILIGMAYSFQYENESFQEKHDVKMDYVITQKGILK